MANEYEPKHIREERGGYYLRLFNIKSFSSSSWRWWRSSSDDSNGTSARKPPPSFLPSFFECVSTYDFIITTAAAAAAFFLFLFLHFSLFIAGLFSWDVSGTQIDIESELRNIATQCPQGEELRNGNETISRQVSKSVNNETKFCKSGEKLIQLASDSLVTEILIHPQLGTLKQCMRNLLASFTRHRHVIHAGYTLSGTGSWILQVANHSINCRFDLKNTKYKNFIFDANCRMACTNCRICWTSSKNRRCKDSSRLTTVLQSIYTAKKRVNGLPNDSISFRQSNRPR